MGKNGSFDELIKKAEKINKQLAKEVAPEINKLFKESVYDSLIQSYSEYSPNMYQRTNNFMNIYNSAYTHANGNILTMHVDSSKMNDYPGFDIPPYPTYERQTLSADTAFDYMFTNGEHGHGRWMMYQSIPPFDRVDKDFRNGFGGRVQKIIDNKAKELFLR